MTGPEHYREAQRLLADAIQEHVAGWDENAMVLTGQAQVHATLALAAATAVQPATYGSHRLESTEWTDVASVETAARKRGCAR